MNIKKLKKLADFLRTVDHDRFRMGVWAEEGFGKSACGTAACGLGWATQIFEELKLHGEGGGDQAVKLLHNGDWIFNLGAAMEFFELNNIEAANIFFPNSYACSDNITSDRVADRIERYIHAYTDGSKRDEFGTIIETQGDVEDGNSRHEG